MPTHEFSAWGDDDKGYKVVFYHTKYRPATLEQPAEPEDVEIEQVFCDGKEVQVSDSLIDKFITQAWEYLNDDEDPPDDWKREWECNYER